MSVSEMTQWLLLQSEEASRRSEADWPRFHDLIYIYQMQNVVLAASRKVSSSNETLVGNHDPLKG
jgi:hypothetical protein